MTAPAMARVARWSIAHRWLVIAGWVLLAVAGSLAAAADTSQAVIRGIGYTGRLVTSGALILCLAFIALGGVPVTDVKILSTGLAAGIIIDATLIRGILAPALVALLGRFNWWLPAPAARLLHVTPLTPHPAAERHATPGSGPGASPPGLPNATADRSPRRFS